MLQINLVEHQIYKAALKWFLEIVKIMAPLRNNPWDPNDYGDGCEGNDQSLVTTLTG